MYIFYVNNFFPGTFAYRAPELLRGEQPSAKADVYSAGITFWQMLSRDMPYNGQNQHVVIFGVVAYNLRPALCLSSKHTDIKDNSLTDDIPATSPDDMDPIESCYRDLFVQCWQPDPRDRPVAADLVEVFSIWEMYL